MVANTNAARAVILNGGNLEFHVLNRFVAILYKLESLEKTEFQLRKCLHKICL